MVMTVGERCRHQYLGSREHRRSTFHSRALTAIEKLGDGPVAITRQISREYLAVVTRQQSFMDAMPLPHAIAEVRRQIGQSSMLEDGPHVWAQSCSLSERFSFGGKQIQHANIVATMLAHGETELLTLNVKDFRRLAPLITIIVP